MWCSSLHSRHDQKGRHPGRWPTCIWITICLADSLHQIFMCAFAVWKTKTNLFTNLNVHDCLPDFYVRPCLRASMHWRVKGQKWRCYSLVIHHEGDTLSPALRDAQAMFYKRITRQRAPTGHPLPPCATCRDVHTDAALADFRYSPHILLILCLYNNTYCVALLLVWRTL